MRNVCVFTLFQLAICTGLLNIVQAKSFIINISRCFNRIGVKTQAERSYVT